MSKESKTPSPDDLDVDQAFGSEGGEGQETPDDGALRGDDRDLEAALTAEKDRSLRLQAELQNVLNRKARELEEERRFSGLQLVRDVLPVLDNIDRAIVAAEKAEKAEEATNLIDGFRLVRQQLAAVLQQHNCEPINDEGAPFDPDYHEAILQQPSADVPAGSVLMTVQTGYKLHDRVVRPAQVIVSAGPPPSDDNSGAN